MKPVLLRISHACLTRHSTNGGRRPPNAPLMNWLLTRRFWIVCLKQSARANESSESNGTLRSESTSELGYPRQPEHQRRRMYTPQHSMGTEESTSSSSRASEVPTSADSGTSMTRQLMHYKSLILNLQNGTDQEAEELLHTLRSPTYRGQLPGTMAQRSLSRDGIQRSDSRPEEPTRSMGADDDFPQRPWSRSLVLELGNESALPQPAASRPGQTSFSTPGSNVCSSSPWSGLPPTLRPSADSKIVQDSPHSFGVNVTSATDMREYITSSHRRQKRSERTSEATDKSET